MIINTSISFALFILGSISGPLIDYLQSEGSRLLGVAKAIYFVIPSLRANTEVFSAIGLGKQVSWSFVGLSSLYCVLYIVAAICAAVFLFQDRELG
jgi:ABC-type transport system involved in multi-copper enzyme maturation permease subunit